MAFFRYRAKREFGGDIRYSVKPSREILAKKRYVDASTIEEVDRIPPPLPEVPPTPEEVALKALTPEAIDRADITQLKEILKLVVRRLRR